MVQTLSDNWQPQRNCGWETTYGNGDCLLFG
jgi:hypothetical protein